MYGRWMLLLASSAVCKRSTSFLREVACAELSLVRQRYLHRRVARALVEVYGADIESWNGQIASHFEQAGMAEEAIEHYSQAAACARQRYADTEAADLLRRALALCRGFSESDRRPRPSSAPANVPVRHPPTAATT